MIDHSKMIVSLKEAQETEWDNRDMSRESDHFLNKRDGQWEPEIINRFSGKPRYSFDECNPIVDDIMGEMEAMDFNIRITPAGAQSSKQTAQQFEGIVRTIENISSARFSYNAAARAMVGTGIDGWRVVQEYRNDDSFQQDLMIKHIPNFVDTVWFDPDAQHQTMKDASFGWVLTSMTKEAYKKKYPTGSLESVESHVKQQVYSYKKPHEVMIGEYLFKKKKKRELGLLSDGRVVVLDEDFAKIRDDLFAKDIKVTKTRMRPYDVVYQKVFDGADWLTDEKETVFSYLPIVPVYGNFRISENKVIYWSVTEKLMDAQRVKNYAESRKIEEGALSPRGKIWMTKEQAASASVKMTLRTLNTNVDPVQFYDHVDGQLPPAYQGAPASNPGLQEVSQSAQSFISRVSGTFDESRGLAPAGRSGTAVNLLQNKSDNPKRKWFTSMEIGIQHTANILVAAIPKVYDTQQEMILTGQDGSTDVITLKDKIFDEDTEEFVEINDLNKGTYNIVCSAGPAFQSKQQETVTAITELATIDPSIIEMGSDVLLNNISAPGIDKLAERKRLQLLGAGMIPPGQQTEEEKKVVAAQQEAEKNAGPTPTEQANLDIAEAQKKDADSKDMERRANITIEDRKLDLKEDDALVKAELAKAKLASDQQQQMVDAVTSTTQQLKTQAETLKLITEALAIKETPAVSAAHTEQAKDVTRDAKTN